MLCIQLAQDSGQGRALVNKVMNLLDCIKCRDILEQMSDWGLLQDSAALGYFLIMRGCRLDHWQALINME